MKRDHWQELPAGKEIIDGIEKLCAKHGYISPDATFSKETHAVDEEDQDDAEEEAAFAAAAGIPTTVEIPATTVEIADDADLSVMPVDRVPIDSAVGISEERDDGLAYIKEADLSSSTQAPVSEQFDAPTPLRQAPSMNSA